MNLKDIFVFYSETNKAINAELGRILAGLSEAELEKKRGSYHGGLLGLANHILLSDLGWYVAIRDSSGHFPPLEAVVLHYDDPGWGEPLYSKFAQVSEHQQKLDELAVQFISSLTEAEITKTYDFELWNGAAELPLSTVLLHVLNHATHHRGAIAHILDELNIENDYSNVIFHHPNFPQVGWE